MPARIRVDFRSCNPSHLQAFLTIEGMSPVGTKLPSAKAVSCPQKHIWPRWEKRIAAAGKYLSTRRDERRWFVAHIVGVSLDEVFRMIANPGMVWRDVVRDEIEDEAQSALAEHGTRGGESLRAAEVLIDDVPAHAVGRADVVLRDKVGERSQEIFEEPRVAYRDRDSSGAALPDAHEPHGIKATGGDAIPLLRRHRTQVQRLLVFPAKITQPDPGVDLIDDRMLGPGAHRFYFLKTACLPPSKVVFASSRPKSCIVLATSPVQPVWWLAPSPAPLSPWKYS